MTVYYLDASAWIKHDIREQGSDWVSALFRGDALLSCATLGLIEVAAASARKLKGGRDPAALSSVLDRIRADWVRFHGVAMGSEIVERALRVAAESALRGADAVHLASALALGVRLGPGDELRFVTSDRELAEAARQKGLPVLDPVSYSPP